MEGAELVQDIGSPECGGWSFVSLVPGTSAGPIHRLLHGVHRKQPKADRQPVVNRHFAEPVSRLAGHILEVRSVAPDHGPEDNQTAVNLRLSRRGGCRRQLEGAWKPYNVNGITADARFGAA